MARVGREEGREMREREKPELGLKGGETIEVRWNRGCLWEGRARATWRR